MVCLQRCLIVTWLVPRETAAVSARSVYTIQPSGHFIESDIRRVHACLVVNGHLHFWQNDGDRLRATAVTRGWNGYGNDWAIRDVTLLWQLRVSTIAKRREKLKRNKLGGS